MEDAGVRRNLIYGRVIKYKVFGVPLQVSSIRCPETQLYFLQTAVSNPDRSLRRTLLVTLSLGASRSSESGKVVRLHLPVRLLSLRQTLSLPSSQICIHSPLFRKLLWDVVFRARHTFKILEVGARVRCSVQERSLRNILVLTALNLCGTGK